MEIIINFGKHTTRVNEITTQFPLGYKTTNITILTQILNTDTGHNRRIKSYTTTNFSTCRTGDINTAFHWLSIGY